MKKSVVFVAVVFVLLAFSGTGWTVPLAEVGAVDTLYDSALLANSGYETELAWIQSVLGTGYFFGEEEKYDDFDADPWEAVDGTGYWAWNLNTAPEYFYIKIGTGSLPEGTADHYLFANLAEFDWAVIDPADIMAEFPPVLGALTRDIDIFRISHIGEIGGNEVPEPGSLLLLGVGMIGIAGLRRKIS